MVEKDDSKSAPKWAIAIGNYLRAGYYFDKQEYEGALRIRAFAKWWMEFCRNFIVVVAVNYIAAKIGSIVLTWFAWATYAIFFAFVTSYFGNWSFSFFPYIQNNRLRVAINLALFVPFFLLAFGTIAVLFRYTYDGLLAGQLP